MNDILARARKLLAKGERTDNEHEAEAFTKKAMGLLAKYGIDEALLAEEDPDRRKVGQLTIECHAPFSLEKVSLLATVADASGCRTVYEETWRDGVYRRASQSDRQIKSVHLMGHEADIRRVELLYTSLLLQQATALKNVEIPWHTTSPAAYRRSWLAGYAAAIRSRMAEATRDAVKDTEEATGRSTELVLADRRAEVDEAFKEAFPDAQLGRPRSLNGSGFTNGYAEGEKADIGSGRVQSGMRGAISG